MPRIARLHDDKETKDFQVPDNAPRELIQLQRITGEMQDGVEYIYRLRGINKAGIASYHYHSCRRIEVPKDKAPTVLMDKAGSFKPLATPSPKASQDDAPYVPPHLREGRSKERTDWH